MFVENLTTGVALSLQNMWGNVILFVPNLIGALVILILGLVIGSVLGMFVEKVFDALKLDKLLAGLGLSPYFDRAGLRLRASRFLGQLVNWFIIIAFLLPAADVLKLSALSNFLNQVLTYLPNVFVAVLIMLASVVLANFLRRLVQASVMSARLHAAHFLGALTWWTIVVLGFVQALIQLGIGALLQTLITGLIAMLALAGGLAFGLGGKEYAAHLLGRLREQTESR